MFASLSRRPSPTVIVVASLFLLLITGGGAMLPHYAWVLNHPVLSSPAAISAVDFQTLYRAGLLLGVVAAILWAFLAAHALLSGADDDRKREAFPGLAAMPPLQALTLGLNHPDGFYVALGAAAMLSALAVGYGATRARAPARPRRARIGYALLALSVPVAAVSAIILEAGHVDWVSASAGALSGGAIVIAAWLLKFSSLRLWPPYLYLDSACRVQPDRPRRRTP